VSADEQRRLAEAQAQTTAELREEVALLREINTLLTDALECATGRTLPRLGQPAGDRPCRVPPPLRRCRPGGRRLW
jgi:hypothetical protein